MKSVVGFFRGVGREVRKTSWPKRKELTKMTITVFTTVILMMVFFAITDLGFSALIRLILE